jgi:hypothetical protein
MVVAQSPPCELGALPLTSDSPSRDEIPDLAHFFLIESRLLRQKAAPASGEKLGPRRRSNTDRRNTHHDERVPHAVGVLLHNSKDSLQARFIPDF